jgi:hypothetical protein
VGASAEIEKLFARANADRNSARDLSAAGDENDRGSFPYLLNSHHLRDASLESVFIWRASRTQKAKTSRLKKGNPNSALIELKN